jgi:O-antigen ligase
VLLVGAYDRAGLLAFLAVFAVCSFLRPHDRSLWRLAGMALAGVMLLAVSGVRVKMPGREREISFVQLVENVGSVVGSSRAGDLDDTKEWRLEWWGDIYRYTVEGEHFWAGKGFGVNLADDDGYQVEEDGSLRNPHNGHLTMLARGGVPGLCLWALAQLSWAWAVFGAYLHSERARERRWAGLFLFLLAYWLAFMVNTTFDVFLEGPMGGVWFWVLYGVGLAALWAYRHKPAALAVEVTA